MVNGSLLKRQLCAEQRLVKSEQDFVYLVYIVIAFFNKVLNNEIKYVTMGQGVSGFTQQIKGFVQIQFKSNGKGDGSSLAGIVAISATDF